MFTGHTVPHRQSKMDSAFRAGKVDGLISICYHINSVTQRDDIVDLEEFVMAIEIRAIADAQKKALALVEDPERRRILEQFLESSAPLIEAAAREALLDLVDEINAQLAPEARLRLIQEGTNILPEIVSLGEEAGRGRRIIIDSHNISKVLVRMPSEVKAMAAEAAQKAGTSMNNWTVNILERALVNLRDRQEKTSQSGDRGDEGGTIPTASTPQDTGT